MAAKKKKKTGRKAKVLTDAMEERFLRAISLGCPIKDACGCAGLGESTYYAWMVEANEGKTARSKRLKEFQERIKEAEGEATMRWLAHIEAAANDGSWQAAAWKLERRRQMFVPKVKQEVSLDAKVETTDIKQRLLDKLAKFAEEEGEDE